MRSKSALLLLGAALPPKMAFFGLTACRVLALFWGHNRPMSLHIGAQKGEISEKILLPGDPSRAKWVAENYLDGAKQYNSIRNMFGYTGTYRGERISVQGTGMGLPSLSIMSLSSLMNMALKQLFVSAHVAQFKRRQKLAI
ncbi:PNP_EcPNPI-like domain containing protein [Candidatus Nanopelagicaceae bacterium]